MKSFHIKAAINTLLLGVCSAFVHPQAFSFGRADVSQLKMAYELEAEPEGGEEIQAIDTMAGSRVKNMGIADGIKAEDGSDAYTFWMTAEADGQMIKKYRDQVSRDAAKNANFPGFRKGQIPPYAQPQMTMFALQEGIIKTCEAAVGAYGLVALSGSDGSVEVHEDVQEIVKGYKVGTSVQFTATFKASFDPEKQESSDEQSEESEIEEKVMED